MRICKSSILFVATLSAGTLTLTGLTGCGGGSKPSTSKKADGEINAAKQALESAKTMQSKAQYAQAIDDIKRAQSKIKEGLVFASGPDKRSLESLSDEALSALSICEAALAKQPKPVAATTKEVASEVVMADPNAAKKLAAEAKLKKETAEAEVRKKAIADKLAIDNTPAPKATPKDEDETTGEAVKPKGDTPENAIDAALGNVAKEKKPKSEPVAQGLFPPMTEKSPDLEVVKITYKGKCCFAYFQVNNHSEDDRRIRGHTVIFTDKNNDPMNRDQSVIVAPFAGFSENAKDPTEQPGALTMDSHVVKGLQQLQLVAICEMDNAKNAKKVGIRIAFTSGPSFLGEGTAGPAAPAAKEEVAPPKIKLK